MSLADELEVYLSPGCRDDVYPFLYNNKDAILSALRGRDAVLEEAAIAITEADDKALKSDYMLDASECAAVVRAMKENKHG